MKRRALLAAFLLLPLSARPSFSYQRDEHFYTTRLTLGPGEADDTAALCSQLADEAPELNALAVYERLMEHPADYANWSVFGRGPDATAGRVATVQ